MKKILSLTALTLGAVVSANGLFSKPAYAAIVTGDVQIKATVPEVVFLETYTDITFNLSASDLTSDVTNATPTKLIQTQAGVVTSGASTVTSPLTGSSTFNTSKSFADVLVYKTWGTGGATGRIRHGAGLIDGTGASATSATLSHTTDATSTMTLAASKALESSDAPGLDGTNPDIDGLVTFDFTLNGIKKAGTYQGATLRVSAEGI
jgi:hypothetical protein